MYFLNFGIPLGSTLHNLNTVAIKVVMWGCLGALSEAVTTHPVCAAKLPALQVVGALQGQLKLLKVGTE